MRIRISFLCLLAVFLMLGFAANLSMALPVEEDIAPEAMILNPGMASSCQNDFIVENIGDELAELKLVLGNEDFMNDRILKNDAKAYGLMNSISMANMQGKNVSMDDVATIFNIGDNARIKVHCIEK